MAQSLPFCMHANDNMSSGMQGRHNKVGTMKVQMDCIPGALKEFGHAALHRLTKLQALVDQCCEGKDVMAWAVPFLPKIVLLQAWGVVLKLPCKHKKKLALQAHLLTKHTTMSHPSCVTPEHCPLLESCTFPVHARSQWSVPNKTLSCQDETTCLILSHHVSSKAL